MLSLILLILVYATLARWYHAYGFDFDHVANLQSITLLAVLCIHMHQLYTLHANDMYTACK